MLISSNVVLHLKSFVTSLGGNWNENNNIYVIQLNVYGNCKQVMSFLSNTLTRKNGQQIKVFNTVLCTNVNYFNETQFDRLTKNNFKRQKFFNFNILYNNNAMPTSNIHHRGTKIKYLKLLFYQININKSAQKWFNFAIFTSYAK